MKLLTPGEGKSRVWEKREGGGGGDGGVEGREGDEEGRRHFLLIK